MFGELSGEFLIRSIEDRIEKWERCADGSLLVKPKKANFDELAVIFRRIFMDTEYNFIATISLVKDPKDRNKALRIFQRFGDLSFELRWKGGLLTKKPIFVESTPPIHNKKALELDSELGAFLNSQEGLMMKIQKLKPEELSINLMPLGDFNPSNSVKDATGFSLSLDQSPAQVSWVISLSKIIYRTVDYPSKVRAIFDVLDDLSGVLREINRRHS